jgi:hypothetical protein
MAGALPHVTVLEKRYDINDLTGTIDATLESNAVTTEHRTDERRYEAARARARRRHGDKDVVTAGLLGV